MGSLQSEFMAEVERRGMAARIVSVERLPQLEHDIHGPRDEGILDQGLVRTYLSGFEFSPPSDLPSASRIVVLAHPEPLTVAEFGWLGEVHAVAIPPIYLPAQAKADRQTLTEILEQRGYRATRARLPLKTLAVRSGLGQYGRNNVCYVPGMGSFLRLEAFYTDAPLDEDGWGEKGLMDACAHCRSCQVNCPTGAIRSDRFIIHAERCLTFFNELEYEFPDWLQSSWHNALIGCMHCQASCPENAQFVLRSAVGEKFSEDETAAVLAASDIGQLSSELQAKLQRLEWGSSNFALMQRNLRALLFTAD